MKKTYIGQCEHLCNCHITDPECLKRYIHIVNPKTNQEECLVFCNDYLKLNASQNSHQNYDYKQNVLRFIESEIFQYLDLKNEYRPIHGNSLSEYKFPFYISKRPYIYGYFSIKQLIEWYFDNQSQLMADLVRQEICKYLNNIRYVKYKTKYKSLITLSNKLKYNYNVSIEEKQNIILELINETFKLTIKNN
jgi:hypothetical protein